MGDIGALLEIQELRDRIRRLRGLITRLQDAWNDLATFAVDVDDDFSDLLDIHAKTCGEAADALIAALQENSDE